MPETPKVGSTRCMSSRNRSRMRRRTQPVTTYRLAIGDRVKHLGGEDFQLVQSGVKITRTPT